MSALWLSAKHPVITSLHERLPKKATEPRARHWLVRDAPVELEATSALPVEPVLEEASAEVLYQEALQRAEQAQQLAEDELSRLVKGLQQLEEVAQRIAKPSVHDVVSLALTIAKEIVSSELTHNAAPFYVIVQEALQSFSQEKHVIVRANPMTVEKLLLLDKSLGEGALSLVSDASLQIAEVLIETPTQAISYQPVKQLDLLRDRLIALLSQREVSDAQ
jgi:flagellar biosynthesis/type III secretory pathway protein FliH